MNYLQQFFEVQQSEKHKVFVSYHHAGDQAYRNSFEKAFGNLFISKSVQPGDIDSDVSTEYIKHLIQDGYISDCSVFLVLIGPHTYGRKHVDWEISAALNYKVGDCFAGLVGILLPNFPLTADDKYQYDAIPDRLADNVKSGYAKIYKWNDVCASADNIKNAINGAFSWRDTHQDKIDNTRIQKQRDTAP